LYLLKNKSRHLVHIKSRGAGKATGDNKEGEYFGKVVAEIKRNLVNYLVVAGPGFAKDNIKPKIKDLDTKIFYDSCSHAGGAGLQEILKRGAIENIVKNSREVEETNLVEKFLEELAKEAKAVYGLKETKEALERGAVDILLISDKKVREVEDYLKLAEKNSTRVVIISSEHQQGEKLFRLGGIAGILRYKLY
jgi:protein pelota